MSELLRLGLSDYMPDGGDGQWASRALARSLQRVTWAAVAVFQAMMLWSVASADLPVGTSAALLAAHTVLLGLALMARAGRFPAGPLIVLVFAIYLMDLASAPSMNSVLVFAACWVGNLMAAAPALTLRGRGAIVLPVAIAVLVPIPMFLLNREWGMELPQAFFVTQLAIMAATRLSLAALFGHVRKADELAAAAEAELHALTAQSAASRAAADDARTLHDTVINTMGAIASGAARLSDADTVRARCAHDAATARSVGSFDAEPVRRSAALGDMFESVDVHLDRTGLGDVELQRIEEDLPDRVIRALVGTVGELVLNVAKHAQTQRAEIDVRLDGDELVVTVTDRGIGFDGPIPPDRGLATSVLARSREEGILVALDSVPGRGTTVTLRRLLDGAGSSDPIDGFVGDIEGDLDEVLTAVWVRAAWLWPLGVTAVGLVLALSSTPTSIPVYAMLALGAVVSGIAWFTRDPAGQIPMPMVVVIAFGSSLGFVLSAAATDFGRTDVVHWQAVTPTAALIPLVIASSGYRKLTGAMTMFVATVLGLSLAVRQDSVHAASVIAVAGTVAVGLVLGWCGFQQVIRRTGEQAAEDHRVATRARLEIVLRTAAEESRRRWSVAGLHEAVELLESIAGGAADPAADLTRAACGEEESYLRQLTQINSELVHTGEWFARALHASRTSQGTLVLRSGEVDAPDARIAARLGTVLLAAVEAMPQHGQLVATFFPSPEGLRMTLVSARGQLRTIHDVWDPSADLVETYTTLDTQDLLEVVVRGPAEA